jgi:hypothetical protein
VIAAAIDEHIEGLPDPANLGHVTSDEANALSRRVTERASLGFRDRGSREIHTNYLESVRRQ